MESVTTNPFIVQLPRERECLRHLGYTAVKGRVETGYLEQRRIKCERGSNRGKIVRLVQWRQRNKGLKLSQQFPSYTFWLDSPQTSMHYAMTKRNKPAAAELLFCPRN